MSQIQKQYSDEAFRRDLKKLKMISKKQNINSFDKSFETRTVFTLKPSTQINKRYLPALKKFQKSKHNENFTFVKVNKPEIKKNRNESYIFQDRNMLAMSDIKMPIYQDLHFHLNIGVVQNKQSPSYFLYPYLKYYYDEKTLFKIGYYKSRSNHVSLSALRNIYADFYISGEYKFGEYIQGVPLSQKTFRLIKMNSNSQLYINYGDMNQIGYQYQLWKRGNYKGVFNFEFNDLQFQNSPDISSNIYFRTQLTKKIQNSNFSLNLQSNNSMVLSEQEINASYKINNSWKVKLGVQVQTDNVNIIAGFKKSNFEISLPIIGFEFSTKKFITALGFASILAVFGFSYYKKYKIASEKEREVQFKKQFEENITKRKGQISLIETQSQENNQYQINRNGLVIIEGYYGNSKHIAELQQSQNRANYMHVNKERAEIIDVTIPLRFLQNKKGLQIQTLSKENLIGFFNPCRETTQSKSLFIRYSLKGEIQEEIFMDDKDVILNLQN